MDARPVGVFDSGVGGLTVLHECLVTMPHEDFVYLGDNARLPYGPRELGEVRHFRGQVYSWDVVNEAFAKHPWTPVPVDPNHARSGRRSGRAAAGQ